MADPGLSPTVAVPREAPTGYIDSPLSDRMSVRSGLYGRTVTFPAARQRIVLGEGLVGLFGRRRAMVSPLHTPMLTLTFDHHEHGTTLCVARVDDHDTISQISDLVVLVEIDECDRTFGFTPPTGRWHVSSDLRAITTVIATCTKVAGARTLYLRAKGLELVCETLEHLRLSSLTPYAGSSGFSEADTRRLIAARTMIEQRLQEPLTLDGIARACGVNRAKLSRGFRELFGRTVATVIRDTRMECAKKLLLTSDLAIATIGFRSGFLNNASFARAFCRHYGSSPKEMRVASRPQGAAFHSTFFDVTSRFGGLRPEEDLSSPQP